MKTWLKWGVITGAIVSGIHLLIVTYTYWTTGYQIYSSNWLNFVHLLAEGTKTSFLLNTLVNMILYFSATMIIVSFIGWIIWKIKK